MDRVDVEICWTPKPNVNVSRGNFIMPRGPTCGIAIIAIQSAQRLLPQSNSHPFYRKLRQAVLTRRTDYHTMARHDSSRRFHSSSRAHDFLRKGVCKLCVHLTRRSHQFCSFCFNEEVITRKEQGVRRSFSGLAGDSGTPMTVRA